MNAYADSADMIQRQRDSRARIRVERNGNPSWVDLGDGFFALHIQYGGGAVIVRVQGGDPPGSEDIAALREWLAFHWPVEEEPSYTGNTPDDPWV